MGVELITTNKNRCWYNHALLIVYNWQQNSFSLATTVKILLDGKSVVSFYLERGLSYLVGLKHRSLYMQNICTYFARFFAVTRNRYTWLYPA